MQANPIRRIGSWTDMSPEQRRRAVTRGLDKIFDPGLREDIARLIEDVRVNGDAALVRALKAFDGCDVEASRLRVTEAEFAAARARKRTAVAKADQRALRRMSDSIIAFTQHEGFPAHEAAVRIRLEEPQ